MAERSRAHRVLIEDTRENGQYLRVTWHRDAGQFVLSHWRDDTCVAATRIDPAAAADLVRLLADGLADAATGPESWPQSDDLRWKRSDRPA